MSVYKRNDSPYYWMSLPVVDDRGNIVRYHKQSTKRTRLDEAKEVFRRANKQSLDEVQLDRRKRISIGEVARQYILELKMSGRPAFKDYQSILNKLSRLEFDLPIQRLDRSFLQMIKQKRITDGLNPSSINNEITFWIACFNKAQNDYDCDLNKQNFKKLKLKTVRKTRYLLDGEEEDLFEHLPPSDSRDLVILLLDTGARINEVCSLTWDSVAADLTTINFYRTKVQNEGLIFTTDRVKEVLSRRKTNGSIYVFPSRCGTKPRGYSTRTICDAIELAGLNAYHKVERYGKFTPHSFRHTFASRLVQGGVSLYAVSKLLGHSDIQMTQRYAHLVPNEEAQQAADLLTRRAIMRSRYG